MVPGSGAALLGRTAELDATASVTAGFPDRGGALVLRGEPGIGKTALLDAVETRAATDGIAPLRTVGIESESGLPFAGLHRLVRPVLDHTEALPAPYRQALLAAFGLASARVRDPFLVGCATLELLFAASSTRPLLALVDDFHWLDELSRQVVAFVGRRIEADPLALLITLRDGYEARVGELGLPERRIAPLERNPARALLEARHPGLAAARQRRVLDAAAGNPLALVELYSEPQDPAPRLEPGAMPELTARLEASFARRLRDLPADTRRLLLLGAADASLELSELLAAGRRHGNRPLDVGALQPAVDAGLVSLAGLRVDFRHPLVRSAVYNRAGIEERRAAHAALAAVLPDLDRQARHRSLATLGRDESVAADVAALGDRMHSRGATLDAALAYGRAADLSTDPASRTRRLLGAADLAFQAGRPDLVERFVGLARGLPLGSLDRARADWLGEVSFDGRAGDEGRILALVASAERVAGSGGHALALALLNAAALRSYWYEPAPVVRDRIVEAVDALELGPDDDRALAIVAMAAPIERAAEILAGLASAGNPEDPERLLRLALAAHHVGDWGRSVQLAHLAGEPLRAQGRLGLLTHALGLRTWGAIFSGRLDLAGESAADFERIAAESGQRMWRAGAHIAQGALLGLRGDEAGAQTRIDAGEAMLPAGATGALPQAAAFARGVAHLSAGRFEDAYAHLIRRFDPADPAFHHREQQHTVSYLADAAVRTGRVREARALVDRLHAQAAPEADRALLLGHVYARAVLADDDAAPGAFGAAYAAIGPAGGFLRARLDLARGGWLRRRRRPAESRAPLRDARDAFDRMRLVTWSERARDELRASGETSRPRRPEAWDRLSPQELQIARLAARGLTNREIGQRLYLSHRTIGSHLYRIFPKLGITSRAQLAAALPDEGLGPRAVAPGG